MSNENEEKNLWQKTKEALKAAYTWLLRYPVALVISIGVVLVASILLLLGVGDRFNVGGILGRLFGKDTPDPIEIANKVPEKRTDGKGNAIPVGEADKEGWVQNEVEVLDRSSNPFRDKSKVTLKSRDGEEKTVKLPTGVRDTDVDTIIEVAPEKFQVIVKEGPSKIDSSTLDALRS